MLFLTNKLIRILGIDIFDMSKNITIDLMKMIESELIVKYKSYHKRIIIRTLKKLNFDYILSSTTSDQANDLQKKVKEEVVTIQSIFSKNNSVEDFNDIFKDIK